MKEIILFSIKIYINKLISFKNNLEERAFNFISQEDFMVELLFYIEGLDVNLDFAKNDNKLAEYVDKCLGETSLYVKKRKNSLQKSIQKK